MIEKLPLILHMKLVMMMNLFFYFFKGKDIAFILKTWLTCR